MNKLELIILLAKAYNNLDIKEIEEVLSEEKSKLIFLIY